MPTLNLNTTEQKFKEWLDSKGYKYLFIDQSPETYPELFRGITKRPDFLLVINNFGLIAVDVKTRDRYNDFIVDEEEIQKYLRFERIFRLPVWFVFAKPQENYDNWYWLPLSKAVECNLRTSGVSQTLFRAINPADCIIIQNTVVDGIERLVKNI